MAVSKSGVVHGRNGVSQPIANANEFIDRRFARFLLS